MPDIVIIPQRGTSNNPSMHFTGSALANIRMEVLPSGSISFIGTSGSLFNVTDNLLGSLMSVGDVSGLPILEVFSDDRVVMGRYGKNTVYVSGTNVGIGKVPANAVFDVSGSAAISGSATVTGSFTTNGRVTFNNGGTGGNGTLTVAGDITAYRSSTVGIIYFGSGQTNYLYYDGSNYFLHNGNVTINATYALSFNTYGGGWYMQDTSWVRTVNSKNIWVGSGFLGGDGGLTVGYGGTSPPSNGGIISGCVGIGTSSPSTKLAVVGGISLSDNNNIVWGTSGGNQSTGTNTPVITAAASLGFYFIPDGSTSGVRARLTNYGTLLVGDSVEINSSWYNNGVGIFGKNGTDKMIVGYLGSSTSGALIGAHNSALNAWAVTNINGSQIILRSDENERMRIINNGNVGIATSSPSYKLHVVGDIYANGGWFRVSGNNGIYWETHGGGWYMTDSTYIRSYNNKVVMGYNTGGGSGTATAFWATSGNTSNYFGNNQLVLSFGQDVTYPHAIKSRHNAGAAAGNAIDFYTWKQGTDSSTTIGTQHVMSLNGGSVGIGTTTPTAKLEVAGDVMADNVFNPFLLMGA